MFEIIICSSKKMTIRINNEERIYIVITTVKTKFGLAYASFFNMNIPKIVDNIPKLTQRNGDSNCMNAKNRRN